MLFFYLLPPPPPTSPLSPYTTLFRSRLRAARRPRGRHRVRDLELLRLRRSERDAALRAGLAMARVVVADGGVRQGSTGRVPATWQRTSRAPMEPSRSGAEDACRVAPAVPVARPRRPRCVIVDLTSRTGP